MPTFNLCNQFDQKTDGIVSYRGSVFEEYEDVEQPKQEEKKKFDASSVTGKAHGAMVAVGCVAAAIGLGVAWGLASFFSGGAALTAAPAAVACISGLLTAASAAYAGQQAVNAQYQSDMENQEESDWGAYLGDPLKETVRAGAEDVAWQMTFMVGGAAVGAVARPLLKYGGKWGGKVFGLKSTHISDPKITLRI